MVKSDGEIVNVIIGEDESDPVFYINDLLPHLGRQQAEQPLSKAIPAESLNILVGALPYADEEISDKIKLTVYRPGKGVEIEVEVGEQIQDTTTQSQSQSTPVFPFGR
jgi:aspartyl aminopeptidase